MSVIEVNLRGCLLIILFRAWSGFYRGWRRAGRGPGAWGARGFGTRRGSTHVPRGRGAMSARRGSAGSVRPRVSLAVRGASSRPGMGPPARATPSSGGGSTGGGRRADPGRAAPMAAASNSGQPERPVVVLDP